MPRKSDPSNEYQRSATEQSRKKAAKEGRPEASFADAALAAAVYAYAVRAMEEKIDPRGLRWILKAAAAILISHPGRSFDGEAAHRKIIQRAGMRRKADDRRIRKATRDIPLSKPKVEVSK